MKSIITILIIACAPVFSILAPLHQSVKEIKALLSAPELYQNVSSAENVLEVTRHLDTFTVRTDSQMLKIEIIYAEPINCGPRQFEFEFLSSEMIYHTCNTEVLG